jgi:hypothetical protein
MWQSVKKIDMYAGENTEIPVWMAEADHCMIHKAIEALDDAADEGPLTICKVRAILEDIADEWPECGDISQHQLEMVPRRHVQLLWLLGACRDSETGVPHVAPDGHLMCLFETSHEAQADTAEDRYHAAINRAKWAKEAASAAAKNLAIAQAHSALAVPTPPPAATPEPDAWERARLAGGSGWFARRMAMAGTRKADRLRQQAQASLQAHQTEQQHFGSIAQAHAATAQKQLQAIAENVAMADLQKYLSTARDMVDRRKSKLLGELSSREVGKKVAERVHTAIGTLQDPSPLMARHEGARIAAQLTQEFETELGDWHALDPAKVARMVAASTASPGEKALEAIARRQEPPATTLVGGVPHYHMAEPSEDVQSEASYDWSPEALGAASRAQMGKAVTRLQAFARGRRARRQAAERRTPSSSPASSTSGHLVPSRSRLVGYR